MNSMHGSDDQKLDALFRAYNDACVAPEANANFMPNLWARIESRQRFTFSFRRMANALTTDESTTVKCQSRFGRCDTATSFRPMACT